jgi:maleylacetoacetate isomerase
VTITLFHGPTSSASWRVRVALAWKNIAYESVLVPLDTGAQRTPEHLARNPLGQVPTLSIDGLVLSQSVAIVEYLEETRPSPPLYPREPGARATVRTVVEIVNAGIQPLHTREVRERLRSQLGASDAQVDTWVSSWLEKRFASLEQVLSAVSGTCAVGDAITAADVFVYPQLARAGVFGVELRKFAVLERLRARLAEEPAFRVLHA